MLLRFVLYGLLGWCAEVLWTAAYDAVTGTRPDGDRPVRVKLPSWERWRLTGRTYLWMLPIYGAGLLLYERLHDGLRGHAFWLRGAAYMTTFFVGEYLAGYALRKLTGRCPWDYSYTRSSVHGYIRLDYAPVWFAFGLLLERAHDVLVAIEPPLRAALALN